MTTAMSDQKAAVDSGQWLLYRYNPERAAAGENPLSLDSRAPTRKVQEFLQQQTRFKMLTKSKPEDAERLWREAQHDAEERYRLYEYMASRKTGARRNFGECRGETCDRRAGEARDHGEPRGKSAQGGTRGIMIDLTTNYLGLKLRTRWLLRPLRSRETWTEFDRLEDAGASAIVLYSLFEEQLRQEEAGPRLSSRGGHRELCRVAHLFPASLANSTPAPRDTWSTSARQAAVKNPDHRQPQRRHARGMDQICPPD